MHDNGSSEEKAGTAVYKSSNRKKMTGLKTPNDLNTKIEEGQPNQNYQNFHQQSLDHKTDHFRHCTMPSSIICRIRLSVMLSSVFVAVCSLVLQWSQFSQF